ncbi:conserved hypothetical protein [Ricinus communis]|uniref:Uncharacterized protein n=1 Tax=Ricinus communis TaxID=3988 RepID=B9T9G7_RICCO|nr:conserved hypothetical protein [Ricinus communis]
MLLAQQQEHGRLLVEVWRRRGFPLRGGHRADGFGWQAEVGRHAHQRARRAGCHQRVQHGGVAVGRFDEQLRLLFLARALFQVLDALGALGGVGRQVAVEGEALPVQAARHDGQQQRRWPDQRPHRNLVLVRQPHQVGAGIGHRRHAGFRHQAAILAGQQRRQQVAQRGGRGVDVEFGDFDFLHRLAQRMPGADQLEEGARGLGVFRDEVIKLGGDVLHLFGQHVGERFGLAQGVGD